ncbi:hypothetical protein B0T21DRAFT_346544 [Apiosordaria backusii]|uniref:Uncharacterized protein n=1 Tax=Apiosordaria backusii TaxID=314023 RepID=A0AA40EGK3_9PEZI|nr:hypothetical protein B0T21DRAFT_346544 [Apiosordaria backusii]
MLQTEEDISFVTRVDWRSVRRRIQLTVEGDRRRWDGWWEDVKFELGKRMLPFVMGERWRDSKHGRKFRRRWGEAVMDLSTVEEVRDDDGGGSGGDGQGGRDGHGAGDGQGGDGEGGDGQGSNRQGDNGQGNNGQDGDGDGQGGGGSTVGGGISTGVEIGGTGKDGTKTQKRKKKGKATGGNMEGKLEELELRYLKGDDVVVETDPGTKKKLGTSARNRIKKEKVEAALRLAEKSKKMKEEAALKEKERKKKMEEIQKEKLYEGDDEGEDMRRSRPGRWGGINYRGEQYRRRGRICAWL